MCHFLTQNQIRLISIPTCHFPFYVLLSYWSHNQLLSLQILEVKNHHKIKKMPQIFQPPSLFHLFRAENTIKKNLKFQNLKRIIKLASYNSKLVLVIGLTIKPIYHANTLPCLLLLLLLLLPRRILLQRSIHFRRRRSCHCCYQRHQRRHLLWFPFIFNRVAFGHALDPNPNLLQDQGLPLQNRNCILNSLLTNSSQLTMTFTLGSSLAFSSETLNTWGTSTVSSNLRSEVPQESFASPYQLSVRLHLQPETIFPLLALTQASPLRA